ncbi:hypothetical protein SUGI_0762750 [Cryptomeria japonica]|nr:hypothetical protein SUGI_0762750 [Cryptomeria japonica]
MGGLEESLDILQHARYRHEEYLEGFSASKPSTQSAIDTARKANANKDEAARRRQHQGYSNRSSHSDQQDRARRKNKQ